MLEVVSEEVALHAEFLVWNIEVVPKESSKETKERWIGVHELGHVDVLGALPPEEHAADRVQGLSAPSRCPTLGLVKLTASPVEGRDARSWRVSQRLALVVSQLNVAHPETGGRPRDTEAPLDLANRQPLLPELSGQVPFGRFHSRKQNKDRGGRNEKRVAGIEPA